MGLVEEYQKQFAWRAWPELISALPPLRGQRVLDLGCGPGDVAAELGLRGARVVGVDLNEELLAAARAQGIAGAEFHAADLRTLPNLGVFDGVWCSFGAAYFPDLTPLVATWGRHLRPGGWIALTEAADLFSHEPLAVFARETLEAYARDALATGRHDFQMGRKLADHVRNAGFTPVKNLTVADAELSFTGPAKPEVLAAWRARLARLHILKELAGEDYGKLEKEFFACLVRPDHRSTCRVHFVLARRD